MKTTKDLVDAVHAELNAVKAADMGLEAAMAFAQEARNQFETGDTLKTKEALDNLLGLLPTLRKAVPANVTPASAGPVGKAPHEQELEQAFNVANAQLDKLQAALPGVLATIQALAEVIDSGLQARNAAQAGLKSLATARKEGKAA